MLGTNGAGCEGVSRLAGALGMLSSWWLTLGHQFGGLCLYNLGYHVIKHWGETFLLAASGLPHPLWSAKGLQRDHLSR